MSAGPRTLFCMIDYPIVRWFAALSATVFLAAGCGVFGGEGDAVDPQSVRASSSTTASSSATSSSTTASTTTSSATVSSSTQAAECVRGTLGQPMFDGVQCLDKTIERCAVADGSFEFGTTFFTDGTSGYTEFCDSQMRQNYSPPTYSSENEVLATPTPQEVPPTAAGEAPAPADVPVEEDAYPSDEGY